MVRIYANHYFSHFPYPEKHIGFHEKLVNPYPHKAIRFKLYPKLDIFFKNKMFTTNSDGFRGEEFTSKKSKRIVGIGDSVLMGWGVSDRETYLEQLENHFQKIGEAIETINLGVMGYNTVQEYFVLKDYGIKLKPDLVLLQFVGNDVSGRVNYAERSVVNTYSYLINFFYTRLNVMVGNLSKNIKYDWRYVDNDIDYKEDFEWALRKIANLCKEHSIPLILVIDSRYSAANMPHEKLTVLSEKLGMKVINLFEIMRDIPEFPAEGATTILDDHNKKYLLEIGVGKDNHANHLWHKDVSEIIYDYIKKNKLL